MDFVVGIHFNSVHSWLVLAAKNNLRNKSLMDQTRPPCSIGCLRKAFPVANSADFIIQYSEIYHVLRHARTHILRF